MNLVANILTAGNRQMLSAPRYSGASANPSGDWAVYSTSNYSFDAHESASSWKLMKLSTGEVSDLPFDEDVSEMVWVGDTDTSVLYVKASNRPVPGGVTLWTADLANSPVRG